MKRLHSFCLILLMHCCALQVAVAETLVETETLILRFDNQGLLVETTACYPECNSDKSRRFTLKHEEGLIGFEKQSEGDWNFTRQTEETQQILVFSKDEGQLIRWTIPETGYGIALESSSSGAIRIQAGELFRPRAAPGFGKWLEQIRYLSIDRDDVRQLALDEVEAEITEAEWVGFRSRFWTLLVAADEPIGFAMQFGEGNQDPVLQSETAPDEISWYVYLGPVERGSLSSVDELLPDLMYSGLWFWLRWICIALAALLGWIYSIIANWGISIVVLSATVGFLMLPLSRLADRMQQQVNVTEARLAPELTRIKKEFKGEEQAAKIIALYKTERVHPLYSLKSLLGVAVVIPVFIGAFDMLAENIQLMNTSFLWIEDLSRPDNLWHMPFEIPFFGSGLNLLPLLMTGLSVLASNLHRPPALQAELRQKQVRNMILLAVVFFVLFYTFPAGMVLYWTTNNLISVLKSVWAKMNANETSSAI